MSDGGSKASIKTCRVCGQTKPQELFARDAKCRDGHSTKCKDCMKIYSTQRYARNRLAAGKPYRRLTGLDEWEAIEKRGTLTCRQCMIEKPLDDFRISFRAPRRRRMCRDCERRRCAQQRIENREDRKAYFHLHRCRQYGITPEDYDRLLAVQGGKCAICGRSLGQRRQTIDHCHQSGRVRGIVHWNCNLVLGCANEDAHVLEGAIAYLARHHMAVDKHSSVHQGERL